MYNIVRTAWHCTVPLVCFAEAKIPVEDWLNPIVGEPMMRNGQMR